MLRLARVGVACSLASLGVLAIALLIGVMMMGKHDPYY